MLAANPHESLARHTKALKMANKLGEYAIPLCQVRTLTDAEWTVVAAAAKCRRPGSDGQTKTLVIEMLEARR